MMSVIEVVFYLAGALQPPTLAITLPSLLSVISLR